MKKFLCILALGLATALAWSQSADKVTQIIESEKVTYGQFSYFTAIVMGIADENASYEEAFAAIQKEGLAAKDATADSTITLEQIAFLCMKAWNVKGGIMYGIFQNPRYAFRQLKADGIIPESADPMQTADGHKAMNIISACIDAYGTGEAL